LADPRASVLIPTRNPGEGIVSVLEAVFGQDAPFAFEVIVVDSGSSDWEVALMKRFPITLRRIPSREFGQGRTRNLLADVARGELLFFLSQDATPADPRWMSTLAAALDDPAVAGAYARQLPDAGADPFIRFFLARTYGPHPARRHLAVSGVPRLNQIFFSNVSSALRRGVWERVPFRDVVMSEDQYWAHDVLCRGLELRYEPSARVFHTHRYDLRTLFRRNYLSGASLRGLIGDPPAAVAGRALAYVADEALFLTREGRTALLPYMLLYEATRSVAFALGSLRGSRAGGREARPRR
jgi:rhamnosyltransferase